MAVEKVKYKVCSICEIPYPLENFYANKKSRDGLKAECKHCSREARRESHRKKMAAIEREKGRWCPKCKKHLKPVADHFYTKDGERSRWCIRCTEKERRANKTKVRQHYDKFIQTVKERYENIDHVQIENPTIREWEWVRIVERYKHFMVVRTRRYQTSIAWRDIAIGDTKVRRDGSGPVF